MSENIGTQKQGMSTSLRNLLISAAYEWAGRQQNLDKVDGLHCTADTFEWSYTQGAEWMYEQMKNMGLIIEVHKLFERRNDVPTVK